LGLAAALVAGCGGTGNEGGANAGSGEKVQVAATLPFVGDMVREVGGDRVEVSTIIRPGDEVHTFQPSPSDAQKMSEAQLVFENGLGLEQWLEDLVESAGNGDATVVELSEGLDPIEGGETGQEHGDHEEGAEGAHNDEHTDEGNSHEEGAHVEQSGEKSHEGETHGEEGSEEHAGEGHEHAAGNPHFWLSVPNAQHYVENVRDALVETDPERAEEYEDNAENYLEELEELDGYVREQVEAIPEENRKLVTFHDGFPYFAQEYGFELVGVILQNPNAEASSREVAELTREVREEDVPAVFTEPQFNSGLADTIAQEAGVEVHPIYATFVQKGGIVEEDIGSYEEMMRANIDNMVEGLG
jgi:ABC-type Zn uptake system ZnuABC Zn-binding protein ZnuA